MRSRWKPGLYCTECQNTGEVDCHCGGDLCICGAQEIICPNCDGQSADLYSDDDFSGDDFSGEP